MWYYHPSRNLTMYLLLMHNCIVCITLHVHTIECSFMIMAVTRLPAATTLEYMRTGQVRILHTT